MEDNDGVLREMVRTPNNFTSSDSHDSIETESEDNSIVALPCEICDELRPSDKLMEHQEKCIQDRRRFYFRDVPSFLQLRYDEEWVSWLFLGHSGHGWFWWVL